METDRALTNSATLSKERLLRILGVTFGVAVGIGGTIGIGILRVPGSVAAHLGHSGLIMAVWILSGLYAFGHDEDRKSTRLNSSHQIISYAVFCLKKTMSTSQQCTARSV